MNSVVWCVIVNAPFSTCKATSNISVPPKIKFELLYFFLESMVSLLIVESAQTFYAIKLVVHVLKKRKSLKRNIKYCRFPGAEGVSSIYSRQEKG